MLSSMISVSHVSKSVSDVSGPLSILRDIDFSVGVGETVAVLGASGSGKSTLLSIMAGLDTPSLGRVELAGQDIFAMSEDERAAWRGNHLGFVFQNFQLMGHLTALENVMLPLELAGTSNAANLAKSILSQVGLAERLRHFPKVMSGGEQQMLAIGRALMTNPRLLVLDEATEGLAPLIRAEIWQVLAKLRAEGQAILLIDKNLAAVMRLADWHVVIEKGRVVWQGDSSALAAAPEIRDTYLHV